jgi:hypothetical protein
MTISQPISGIERRFQWETLCFDPMYEVDIWGVCLVSAFPGRWLSVHFILLCMYGSRSIYLLLSSATIILSLLLQPTTIDEVQGPAMIRKFVRSYVNKFVLGVHHRLSSAYQHTKNQKSSSTMDRQYSSVQARTSLHRRQQQ